MPSDQTERQANECRKYYLGSVDKHRVGCGIFRLEIFSDTQLYASNSCRFIYRDAGIWRICSDCLGQLYSFGIALLGGMLRFGLGWLGGGDAKLYAAIALWLPIGNAILLLLATVFSGLLLAIIYLITRKARRKKRVAIQSMDAKKESRIPYGIAIVLGAIITASNVGWTTMFKMA